MLKIIPPSPRSQWWFDDFQQPKLDWELLHVDEQGIVSVFDGSLDVNFFDTVRDAEIWLTLRGFDCHQDQSEEKLALELEIEDLFHDLIDGIPTPKLRLIK